MMALFEKEEDKRAISLLFNWFMQLWKNDKISREDYDKLDKVYREAEEVKTMLEVTIKTYKQRLYDEGHADGIERGIERGIEKGIQQERQRRLDEQRTILVGLLNYCYSLPSQQMEIVKDDLQLIETIKELKALINTCLDRKPFDAFRSLLDEMLDRV
ncbi:MAG: hypothetical protein AAF639_36230 [Chloroflexota bacterium]